MCTRGRGCRFPSATGGVTEAKRIEQGSMGKRSWKGEGKLRGGEMAAGFDSSIIESVLGLVGNWWRSSAGLDASVLFW